MRKVIGFIFCLVSFASFSQVNELWNTRYAGGANGIDQAVDMVLDAAGNAYVTGISHNGSNFDVVTVKYSNSGIQEWVHTYGSSGLDEPRAIAIDNAGNIIVVGSRFVSGGDWDIFTLKINGLTGLQSWQQTYTGSTLFDLGNDVAIDASNNIYVAGTYYQSTNNLDYILLKYSSSGSFQWANNGGANNRVDEGLLVEIDNSGNAILGGTAEFTATTTFFDFRIMKINSAGTTIWSHTEDSGFGKLDKPRAMAIDANDDIFIGGSGFTTVVNLEDMLLMKVSNAGALLWKSLHSGNNQANDVILALEIDQATGNVYSTGRLKSTLTAENYHTRAYNATGSVLWSKTYSSTGNNFDEATDITFRNNFLYVTGNSFKSGQGTNYTTIKYDLLGNEQWRTSFNHTTNQTDKASKVLIDNQDNVIVTGSSFGGATNNTDIATIKYCQLETIASPDTAICIGNSVTLTAAATGGFNYIWSVVSGTPISPSTLTCSTCQSPTATPDTTTIYTVRSENAIGCIDFDTVKVTINIATPPVITANPALAFCSGNFTVLSVNNQSYTSFTWNNGGTAASKTVNNAAEQIVTVTDGNGCQSADTVNTTVFSLPIVDAGNSIAICQGQSTQLSASGANTYLWANSPALSQFIISNPIATPTTTQTFSVVGTDINGCQDSDMLTITVNNLPTVTATGGGTICAGDTLPLNASGAISYAWNNPAVLSSATINNPDAFPTQTTIFTVTGTDANNCQAQASATINVNPLPFISAGVNQTICSGNSANLFATGGSTYQWQANPTLTSSAIPNPIATPTATTEYIVEGTNANGCSNMDSITVFVNSLPNVSAGPNTSICLFESTTLNASGANSYFWSPTPSLTGNNSSTPTVQPVVQTTYTVTGTGTNGCSATSTVTVSINSLPVISAGDLLFVCQGDSIQLNATGGTSYLWNFDQSLSQLNISNPFASPTTNTVYNVTGTDANGCQNTDNVQVSISNLPNIFAGNDFSICENDNAQLQASGGILYEWDNSSSLSNTNIFNPLTNNLSSTEWFYVTGFDSNNCSNRDSILVTVNPLPAPPILTDTFPNIVSSYVFGNKWFYNGNLNAGLLNDTIDYVNLGNLGIYTATHTDFNGCTSELSNEIEITKLIYDVSVPEYLLSNIRFNVFPNPIDNGNLSVELFEAADRIIVSDMTGKIVFELPETWSGIHQINMADFESGIYLITVQTDFASKSVKVIKQY